MPELSEKIGTYTSAKFKEVRAINAGHFAGGDCNEAKIVELRLQMKAQATALGRPGCRGPEALWAMKVHKGELLAPGAFSVAAWLLLLPRKQPMLSSALGVHSQGETGDFRTELKRLFGDAPQILRGPDLTNWPTANTEHSAGDALKLGEQAGAQTLDLEWVHLHPTGLVQEDDATAKRKVLAGESFRLAGGLLLNGSGDRFCNELGPAEHIVAEMQKNPGPFRLCLNTAATRELQWQCRSHISRRLMKCYASGRDLAEDMKIPLRKLIDVHDAHAEAFRNTLRAAEAGPWPCLNGRRSWDETSGKTGYGKCDFKHVLVGSRVADEPFHVAQVTPVILYCSGGIKINARAEVLKNDGTPVPGLYAAGESTGGIHGKRALAGNLLLDCLVFGRLAAKSACKYIFGEDDEFRPCPSQASERQQEKGHF
ncbi:unnamed protein product [Durusdinium trenchii]|uniref:FAD-dependent oxidoreductase 2 FAD-binding domain-containing protein n=1 Tax=Durusdinium trenchii TaxID=1381693 RepID=A0ABP0R071_9DINO